MLPHNNPLNHDKEKEGKMNNRLSERRNAIVPDYRKDAAHSEENWHRRASDVKFAGTIKLDKEPEQEVAGGETNRFSHLVFFTALSRSIANSLGLGNVWRFPILAYQNGGGAFLIPYIVVLCFVGNPLLYLERALGQFSSRNSLRIWSLCPALKGVGYAQGLSCGIILSYYMMIVALCQIYFVSSFKPVLPWSVCRPEWKSCVPSSTRNQILEDDAVSSSAELFFVNIILRQSSNIEDGIGYPVPHLVASLFISWLVIFSILALGVRNIGKASYVFAFMSYTLMITLFIKSLYLPGASKGIMFFITPHWEKLIELEVWYAAVTQVFFSLSACTGLIIMFSSYNKFRENIYRDSLFTTILDIITSLLSGCTMFAILGNLAHNLNCEITQVVGSGAKGLAFVSYPDAMAKTIQPQLLSALFFLMLIVIGVVSSVGLLSVINSIFLDTFPNIRTMFLSTASCILGFLIGIIYTTPGGQYILELVDYYGGTFFTLFLAISEIVGVFWIYGLENFCLDIEYMLSRNTTKYWRMCWGFMTPIMMIIVFIYAWLSFEPFVFGGVYVYPLIADIMGYILLLTGMSIVPGFIIYTLYQNRGDDLKKTFEISFSPKDTWGPRDLIKRERWTIFRADALKEQRETNPNASRLKHIILSLTGGYRFGRQIGDRYEYDDVPTFHRNQSSHHLPTIVRSLVRDKYRPNSSQHKSVAQPDPKPKARPTK